jgi:class 3 adenylate cyclase
LPHHDAQRATRLLRTTVNIAARVQALAGPGEIIVTDEVLRAAGAAELVAGLPIESSGVQVKRVAGEVAVHRIEGVATD